MVVSHQQPLLMLLAINNIRCKKSVFLPCLVRIRVYLMYTLSSFAPAYVFANAEHTCSNKEGQYSCSSSPRAHTAVLYGAFLASRGGQKAAKASRDDRHREVLRRPGRDVGLLVTRWVYAYCVREFTSFTWHYYLILLAFLSVFLVMSYGFLKRIVTRYRLIRCES